MSGIFLVLGAILGASSGDKLAIVDVDAPDSMMGIAAQVTNLVSAEAQKQGVAIVSNDELRTSLGPQKYLELKRCAGGPACVVQLLGSIDVRRVVLGQLGRDEKSYLLKLWLVDVQQMSTVSQIDRSIFIASRRLQRDIEQALPGFLRGEAEAVGSLFIDSTIRGATASINGEPAVPLPLNRQLKPGKYEVRIERKNYLPVTRLFTVEANQHTKEVVPLLLKPGELEIEDHGDIKPTTDFGAVIKAVSWPTWIAGAMTVAAAATATGLGISAQAQEKTLIEGYDPSTGVYLGTRRQAVALQDTVTATNITWGVAGAALAATGVLAAFDAIRESNKTSTPAVTLIPSMTVGGQVQGASLVAGGHF